MDTRERHKSSETQPVMSGGFSAGLLASKGASDVPQGAKPGTPDTCSDVSASSPTNSLYNTSVYKIEQNSQSSISDAKMSGDSAASRPLGDAQNDSEQHEGSSSPLSELQPNNRGLVQDSVKGGGHDESKKEDDTSGSDPDPAPGPQRKRKKRNRFIYDKNDDPETLKVKKKRRSVELKLKNLQWTLNQPAEVTGKRQKRAPERFELAMLNTSTRRRTSSMDEAEGDGEPLGTIPWIVQRIRDAGIYSLRMLHRVIFRKQGMFSEKHIRRSVLNFRGFPFDFNSPEIQKRKIPLEKASASSISRLCYILGVKSGEKNEMINNMLKFLHHPTKQQVEDFLRDFGIKGDAVAIASMATTPSVPNAPQLDTRNASQYYVPVLPPPVPPPLPPPAAAVPPPPVPPNPAVFHPNTNHINYDSFPEFPMAESCELYSAGDPAVINTPWEKPPFFVEGTGIKLKFFKSIVANIQVATNTFIELLHRLLFLTPDEISLKRERQLDLGIGSTLSQLDIFEKYFYVVSYFGALFLHPLFTVMPILPFDQLKYICRVLCLPSWHRSRTLLIDTILNFLSFPCLSATKRAVPPFHNIRNAPNTMDVCKRLQTPELEVKALDSEEIEIVPDIHIPDMDEDGFCGPHKGSSLHGHANMEVKLKNFPNIHYQIISTPAAKLNDLHMILYFRPCPLNVVRKNILEFSHFPFGENSPEYHCRRTLLEKMSLESLKTVITVLCLKQYVVDLSKCNIVEAVLRFLLRPSALLNTCTSFPSQPMLHPKEPAADLLHSGKHISLSNLVNEYKAQEDNNNKLNVEFPCSTGEITIKPVNLVPPVPVVKEEPKIKAEPPVPSVHPPPPSQPASCAPLNLVTNRTDNQSHVEPLQKCPKFTPASKDVEESKSTTVPASSETGNNKAAVPPVKDGANRRKSQQPVKIRTKSQYELDSKNSSHCDLDESLAKVRGNAHISRTSDRCVDSDENDNEPLSKFIGHPNDDQLCALISKIIKDSKLEEITMKQVIKMVFSAYPNFDLSYRREFIRSVVRQIARNKSMQCVMDKCA